VGRRLVAGADRLRFLGTISRYAAVVSDLSRSPSKCRREPSPASWRQSLALTPVAAAVLAGCGQADDGFADGMLPIKWDRDNCVRCGMAIGDRRFASATARRPEERGLQVRRHRLRHHLVQREGVPSTLDERSGHALVGGRLRRGNVPPLVAGAPGALRRRQRTLAHGLQPRRLRPGAGRQRGPSSAMAEQTAAAWPANCRPGQATALTDKT
jgi:hypothetical protein